MLGQVVSRGSRSFEYSSSPVINGEWDALYESEQLGPVKSDNTKTFDRVALFLSLLGMELDTHYSANSSSAKCDKVLSVFHKHNFKGGHYGDYNLSKVLKELDFGIPVLARGSRVKKRYDFWLFNFTLYTGGHAFVIDGYEKIDVTYKSKYRWNWVPINNNNDLKYGAVGARGKRSSGRKNYRPKRRRPDGVTVTTTSNTHLMINWGWGYSSIGSRYPALGDWSTSIGNYQYDRNIITGIK